MIQDNIYNRKSKVSHSRDWGASSLTAVPVVRSKESCAAAKAQNAGGDDGSLIILASKGKDRESLDQTVARPAILDNSQRFSTLTLVIHIQADTYAQTHI